MDVFEACIKRQLRKGMTVHTDLARDFYEAGRAEGVAEGVAEERARCLEIASLQHGGTKDTAWLEGYEDAAREIYRGIESGLPCEHGENTDCYWFRYPEDKATAEAVRVAVNEAVRRCAHGEEPK